eukprot:gene13827-15247_t
MEEAKHSNDDENNLLLRKRNRRNAIKPNSRESDQLKEFAVNHQMSAIRIEIEEPIEEGSRRESKRVKRGESEVEVKQDDVSPSSPPPNDHEGEEEGTDTMTEDNTSATEDESVTSLLPSEMVKSMSAKK